MRKAKKEVYLQIPLKLNLGILSSNDVE